MSASSSEQQPQLHPSNDSKTSSNSSSRKNSSSIKHTSSFESLGSTTVHPLLQNPPNSAASSTSISSSSSPPTTTTNSTSTPSYSINYKPRQRRTSIGTTAQPFATVATVSSAPPATSTKSIATPTTSSTNTTNTSSASSSNLGSSSTSTVPSHASTKLQLQNIQACLQTLHFTSDSVGWLIVFKLVSLAANENRSDAFDPIVSALANNHVSLLLPREPLPQGTKVTPEFISDHVIFASHTDPYTSSNTTITTSTSDSPPPSPTSISNNIPTNANFDSSSDRPWSIVTLSGLRGIIVGDKLVFANKVPNYLQTYSLVQQQQNQSQNQQAKVDLGDPILQHAMLGSVPVAIDLGIQLTSPSTHRSPSWSLSSNRSSLHLPKPVPRKPPTNRSSSNSTTISRSSETRTIPTLSSLFGGGSSSNSTNTSSSSSSNNSSPHLPPSSSSPSLNYNDPSSLSSLSATIPTTTSTTDTTTAATSSSITTSNGSNNASNISSSMSTISIWAIQKSVRHNDTVAKIYSALEQRIRAQFEPNHAQISSLLVNFVRRFFPTELIAHCHPPLSHRRHSSSDDQKPQQQHQHQHHSKSSSISSSENNSPSSPIRSTSSTVTSTDHLPTSSLLSADISTISTQFQELFYQIEELYLNSNQISNNDNDNGNDNDNEVNINENYDHDLHLEQLLESVEDIICTELYTLNFCPPLSSSDAHDDNILSSRIAGLNMLDITLDHLGLQLESSVPDDFDSMSRENSLKDSLEDLVRVCGRELAKLSDPRFRSARDKLSVLVHTHTIIVKTLDTLPNIPLANNNRKHDDSSSSSSKQDNNSNNNNNKNNKEVELGEATGFTSSSRSSTRPPSEYESKTANTNANITNEESSNLSNIPNIVLSSSPTSIDPKKDSSSLSSPAAADLDESNDNNNNNNNNKLGNSNNNSKSNNSNNNDNVSSSSADLILPILIYTVIRSNPKQLVSNLLFIQRFRPESLLRGQSAYCLVNFSAVTEFLLNVDMDQLSLGTERTLKTSEFSRASRALSNVATSQSVGPASSLRGRVSHEIDNAVASAGKVLTGVGGIFDSLGGFVSRRTVKIVDNSNNNNNNLTSSKLNRRSSSPSLASSQQQQQQPQRQEQHQQNSSSSSSDQTRQRSQSNVERPEFSNEGNHNSSSNPITSTASSFLEGIDSFKRASFSPRRKDKDIDANSVKSISSILSRDSNASGASGANSGPRGLGVVVDEEQQQQANDDSFNEGIPSSSSPNLRPSIGGRLAAIPGLVRFGQNTSSPPSSDNKSISSSPPVREMTPTSSNNASTTPTSYFSTLANAPTRRHQRTGSRRSTLSNISTSSHKEQSNQLFDPPIQRFINLESPDQLRISDVSLLLQDYKRIASALESLEGSR